MKYPELFKDDVFIGSLNISKWQVYAACISDLAIFMAAQSFNHTGDGKQAKDLALKSFQSVLSDRFSNEEFTGDYHDFFEPFENRIALINWEQSAEGENAFKESPKALIRWAPIDESLKELDGEIVMNSIRFQWQRIRADFIKAFDRDAFLADWKNRKN